MMTQYVLIALLLFCRDTPMRGREARIIQTVPPPNFYGPPSQQQQQQQQHRYIPTSEAYLTRRIGEAVEVDPNFRRPAEGITGKVVANMMSPPNIQQQHPTQQQQIPLKLQAQHRQYQFNSPREVSETDLYLLGVSTLI